MLTDAGLVFAFFLGLAAGESLLYCLFDSRPALIIAIVSALMCLLSLVFALVYPQLC